MPLATLPLEVLEILLLYFGSSDLINVMNVLGVEGSSFFWKEVCSRHGLKGGEQSSWKSVFHQNINWFTRKFIKREYIFPGSNEPFLPSCNQIGDRGAWYANGTNILLKSDKAKIYVWNVEGAPRFVQSFNAHCLTISGSKFVTKNTNEICIYEKQEQSYQKVFTTSNIHFKGYSNISLTDDFFVVFLDDFQSIKVVNLKFFEEFTIRVPSGKVGPIYKLVVTDDKLYLLLNEACKYVLKQYDLTKRTWLNEIFLFQGATLISIPELKISSSLISSWCTLLECRGVTPLKIWHSGGELLQSLSVEFIRSFGIHACTDEAILWMILEGEYVILSTCETTVSIWTVKNPDVCQELQIESFCNKQTIVSSSFLILSYFHCFKVIDFKKCAYLYEVSFDHYIQSNVEQFHSSQYSFVNDNFHLTLSKRTIMGRVTKPNDNLLSTSQGHLENNQGDSYLLTIYDYSGHIRTC